MKCMRSSTSVPEKWPKTPTCLTALFNRPHEALLGTQVVVTEKLDGSNMTVVVKQDGDQWRIVSVFGRNSTLWQPSEPVLIDGNISKFPKLNYGLAKNLDNLIIVSAKFAAEVAKTLGIPEIAVYGEAYRRSEDYASFHPFAYANPCNPDNGIKMMDTDIHRLFCDHAIGGICPPNLGAMDKLLRESKEHVVTPPPIVLEGIFSDCVFHLGQNPNVSGGVKSGRFHTDAQHAQSSL